MTIEDFIEIGKIRSQSSNFKRKLEDTIRLCQIQISKYKKPYVAINDSKDSNTLVYIAQRAIAFWGVFSQCYFMKYINNTSQSISKQFHRARK